MSDSSKAYVAETCLMCNGWTSFRKPDSLNDFTKAASECRRQVNNGTNLVKDVKIVTFYDQIWNLHEKYIEISTNISGIGSLFREISVKMSEM